jgi:hypothetical protein
MGDAAFELGRIYSRATVENADGTLIMEYADSLLTAVLVSVYAESYLTEAFNSYSASLGRTHPRTLIAVQELAEEVAAMDRKSVCLLCHRDLICCAAALATVIPHEHSDGF